MAANEVLQLIENEIPEGRQSLQDSYGNLEKVAQYCEGNYLQEQDKRRALEETKNYTTHSLASVAYQINNLATNFLKLLDLQTNQLAEMESSVNHLSQIVMIHKEKVARREIGVLTTNRSASRPLGVKSGIIFPEQTERPIKYTRKPVDYSVLDDVGHGIKVQSSAPTRTGRSPSLSSQSSTQAPTTKPPTPPVSRSGSVSSGSVTGGTGTLGRSQGGHYRSIAPPIAPPSVPSAHYGPGIIPLGPQQRYEGNYAPTMMGVIHSPPPVGMARPISQRTGPPPSPNIVQSAPQPVSYQDSMDSPLPPPPPEVGDSSEAVLEASPPLPPPPASHQAVFSYVNAAPPPPPNFSDDHDDFHERSPPQQQHQQQQVQDEDPYAATGPELTSNPSWMPKSYLEKVVAIYDYDADKADELSFSENAVIFVIKKNDDGWWEGVMDGTTGLFPSNYVEPCI